MALIDIDYFRRQPLGIKDNLQAEVVQEYIDEAEQFVKDYLDRELELQTYTERIVGTGRYTLLLDETPVTDLIDVSYTGYESDMGTHSTGDFLLHSGAGILEWVNKRYNFRTDRIYIVQYEAGYEVIPGPIKRATALQTVQLMRPMYGGPQQDTPEIVPFADELIVSLLEKYRRKRIS